MCSVYAPGAVIPDSRLLLKCSLLTKHLQLKCSGPPDCQRCRTKNLKCGHPAPNPSSSSHKSNSSSKSSSASVPAPDSSPIRASRSRSQPLPVEHAEAEAEAKAEAEAEPEPQSATTYRPQYGEETGDISIPEDRNTALDYFDMDMIDFDADPAALMNLPPVKFNEDFFSPEAPPGLPFWDGIDPFGMSDSFPSLTTAQILEKGGLPCSVDEQPCDCFSQLVMVNEMVEVNLVRNQRSSDRSLDEILRHQKNALAECETLLECGLCGGHSSFVMLLLSIISRTLLSLKATFLFPVPALDGNISGSSESEVTSSTAATSEYDVATYSTTATGGRQLKATKRPGQRFDNDDEQIIMEALIAARMTKIGELLSQLQKVVDEHDWPAHRDLIRDMQGLLRQGNFST